MTNAAVENIEKWNFEDHLIRISFDMTASNNDRHKGVFM